MYQLNILCLDVLQEKNLILFILSFLHRRHVEDRVTLTRKVSFLLSQGFLPSLAFDAGSLLPGQRRQVDENSNKTGLEKN